MDALALLTFSHIGLAVRSVDEFVSSWGALLGAAQWDMTEVSPAQNAVQLYGEVQEHMRSKVAFGRVAGLPFEVIEPCEGRPHARAHLDACGEGLHHLAFWVADLGAELNKLAGTPFEIVYSPTSLRPNLAGRPMAAAVAGETLAADAPARPPFFSYIERVDSMSWTLELLDARFASAYRCLYGDQVFYPEGLDEEPV
jgi:catechol 2,3-dioxygenase-like lactoylglutathione lyase family enzyme